MNMDNLFPDIFLIDDDDAIRNSTSALLNSQGISVIQFNSAEDFLSRTDNTIRGCVISDFHMKEGLNGIDLLKRMQMSDYQLPVIIISGSLTEPDKVEAIASGAYAILEKIDLPQCLLKLINAALNETG
ncbi:Response regulator protein TodT [Gimesia chilikensis]|uniref:Response regulator protein TodT n=1 Tax=Gimesia chilikensis TaxID=2605989 RepID=A0A517WJR4_9PLAN|nr:response regulator [Gimesia chilikensis]QDU05498.1 Response regulator protein TodT [Gimesia chilikensis]